MTRRRVLAIGLDGFDVNLAEGYMAEGQMPALAALRNRAARFLLDEGPGPRRGLEWENVISGLSPEAEGHWGSVEFDPACYTAWKNGPHLEPWWTKTDLRVVVFDPPALDLCRAQNTDGIVAWGAHNPRTGRTARPAALLDEFVQRFGDYPAVEWIYGLPWPSAARCRLMGEGLSRALEVRGRAARWLAAERLPQWDLFFAVAGELHGGAEGLWHGVDAGHPLHTHPSAAAAGAAMLDIHRSLDSMVGQLVNAVRDATVIVFNMGGMGPNNCDVQSMVLLPELLYRHAFGRQLLTLPAAWTATPNRVPILDEPDSWDAAKEFWIPEPRSRTAATAENLRAVARRIPEPAKSLLKGVRSAATDWRSRNALPNRLVENLDYMPCYRYRNHWPRMPAFALPSFLDGRIRINLRGRERNGIVEMSQYEETCRTLETMLAECRDPRTGEPTVATIERASTANPKNLVGSESDLIVVWRDVAAALKHPRLGLIGPVPFRRTGGHTRHGIAYLAGPGLEPGERGVHSSSDVAPTIVQLLGAEPPIRLAGKTLLSAPVP